MVAKKRRSYPLPKDEKDTFQWAMRALTEAQVPFLVGGAFAVYWYTDIWRNTKDFDVFVIPPNYQRALDALARVGFDTSVPDERWLAKATKEPYLVDVIFGTGNLMGPVDDTWFKRAQPGEFIDRTVHFVPIEELIWNKSFIASRDRYDGGDVNHLILSCQGKLDWQHLMNIFDGHWEVILANLVLFTYVYPSHREYIPKWVIDELTNRLLRSTVEPWKDSKLCRGPLLDWTGIYEIDSEKYGYVDARKITWQQRRQRERDWWTPGSERPTQKAA